MLKILLEFAMEKAALEQRIDSQEINIRNHSIKIMVLFETNLEDHWAGEIGGFCDSITKKLKMNNLYPRSSIYMKHLYEPSLETYEEYENVVNNCLRQWKEKSSKYYSFYKKSVFI